MWFRRIQAVVAGCLLATCMQGMAVAQCTSALAEVQTKFDQLSAWLATSDQAQGWHQYLLTDELKQQLAAGPVANPAIVAKVLSRFRSNAPGLDRRRFVETREALNAWLSELSLPSFDQIFPAIETAKAAYMPLSEADVQDARQKLSEAVQHLDSRLKAAGQIGEGWRSYLGWTQLQEELAKPHPDLAALKAVYGKFNSGVHGSNWRMFTEVRDALLEYDLAARNVGNAQLPQQYSQVLDVLAKRLRGYRENPDPQNADRVSELLRGLQELRQANWLVASIRGQFWRPNVYLELSPQMIEAVVARTVDQIEPVQDCILGTAIRGTGHTTGRVTAELIPASRYAAVDMLVLAATSAQTVGYNRQVQVYSAGMTPHSSRKRLILSESGFSTEPAATNASTDSQIECIAAKRALVRRIAWRQATRQEPQANAIASNHAEQRINARLDEEGARQIAQNNKQFQERFRNPLERVGLFPALLNFSSTPDALRGVAIEARDTEFGAPNAPPSLGVRRDLSFQVHESAVNNFAQGMFGGMVVEDKQFQKDITDLLGYVPEQLKTPEENDEVRAITFPERQPITLTVGKDSFTITIRGQRYTLGNSSYDAMNVTAVYDLKQTDKGPRAVRRGDVEVFPPGFVPGKDRLAAREQVLHRRLQRRFEKVLPQEFAPSPIKPTSGQLAKVGPLEPKEWRSDQGWMFLSYQRAQAAPAAVTVAAAGPVQP